MDAKTQLQRLLRIQELALEIQAARAVVARTPARVEEIEGRFRDRNAEYVAVRDRREELEKDQRDRQGELSVMEETLKKYMDNLMQVKNQREYAAVLKEIDAVKAGIAEHEDAILKGMEEVEKLKVDLDARASHIEEERLLVGKERAQVEADVEEARASIVSCEAERARIEAELPSVLAESIRRVEVGRKGLFLVRAENERCQACHVRLRPQVYQEIKLAARIHACGNCRRFLYYEASLRPPSGEQPRPESDKAGLGAVDGGAV